jgi:hypothetical protein
MSNIVHPYPDGTYYFDEPGTYRFENGIAHRIESLDMPTDENAPVMFCKNCGKPVIFTGQKARGFDTDYLHANLIRRCQPADSGQPYGLEADYEPPKRGVPVFPTGTKRPCIHPTCGFWVTYTKLGWVHMDTHGADVSGHIPKPKLTDHDRDD